MAIIKSNSNSFESGEVYLSQLNTEIEKNFAILKSLLSSYWKSSVDGPLYARNLKAIAICLSQIRLALNDIYYDNQYTNTRTEFLYQTVTNLVFKNESPTIDGGDIGFRTFLQSVIDLFFKGATPDSIKKGVELLTSNDVVVRESFDSARKKGSGYDISDAFTFSIDVVLSDPSQYNTIVLDRNVRILLQILRPAHTLYKIRYILSDEYLGNQTSPIPGQPYEQSKILDSIAFAELTNNEYEDFRKFYRGVKGLDSKGAQVAIHVKDEYVTI